MRIKSLSGNAVIIKCTFLLQTLSRKFCSLLSKYFSCHFSFHLADSYTCGGFFLAMMSSSVGFLSISLWPFYFDLFKSTGIRFHNSLLIKNPLFFYISYVRSVPFASPSELVLCTFDIAGNVFQQQSKGISLLEAGRQFKLLSDGFIRSLVCFI